MTPDSDSHWYVNRCAVDATLADNVVRLLQGEHRPNARALVELSVMAESYVLHDGLIFVDHDGLALTRDRLAEQRPGGIMSQLAAADVMTDEDAQSYSRVALDAAGISFDELHPDMDSLRRAWADEREERRSQNSEEDEFAAAYDDDEGDSVDSDDDADGEYLAEENADDSGDYDSRARLAADFELDEYELRIRHAEREREEASSNTDDYWEGGDDAEDDEDEEPGDVPPLAAIASHIGLSVAQSPVESLDTLRSRMQQVPISLDLYRKLADYYRVSVEQLLRFQGVRQVYIPPILAIVLDRCGERNRSHIPAILRELRDEMSSFRGACSGMQRELLKADSLARQFEICRELDEVQAAFIREAGSVHSRFIYQAWDVVKKGSVLGMLTGSVDRLIDYDRQTRIKHRWQAFFDLWRAATLVSSHHTSIRRVFRADVTDAARLLSFARRMSTLEQDLRRRTIG